MPGSEADSVLKLIGLQHSAWSTLQAVSLIFLGFTPATLMGH